MIKFVKNSDDKKIIIGTEIGLVERLRKDWPDKTILPLRESICRAMKKNTINKLVRTLSEESNVVRVDNKIAERAKMAIERMFELC